MFTTAMQLDKTVPVLSQDLDCLLSLMLNHFDEHYNLA